MVSVKWDGQHRCHRVVCHVHKKKKKVPYKLLQAMAPKKMSCAFGHLGRYTLLVYKLEPALAWVFGYAVGQGVSGLLCSVWTIPVDVRLGSYDGNRLR